MAKDLPFSCDCGTVRGRLIGMSPKVGNHLECYCYDCQAFAHFTGQADKVLDEQGGTQIVQTTAGRLAVDQGVDKLAVVQLGEGQLMRWYASCCGTPVVNTMGKSWVNFNGVLVSPLQDAADGTPKGDVLGPTRGRGFTKSAKGGEAAVGKMTGLPRMMRKVLGGILKGLVTGEAKRSPLFDPDTKQPVAAPKVLSTDERAKLQEKVLAL